MVRAFYQTGCNAILLSGLLARISMCFVLSAYKVTRDYTTMKILIPYLYITQCSIISNGMSCLFNGVGIIGEQRLVRGA